MFNLKGKEFSFEVDVSNLPCGLNGQLQFIEMPKNGGLGIGNNTAGAKYGTGFCNAECTHDNRFVAGKANLEEWNSTTL
jgi:cellulose 1,4-beta-cellobiosidase